MICVRMRGGRLGNQLFQYAFARMLQEENPEQEISFDWGDMVNSTGGEEYVNSLQHFNIPSANNTFAISDRMSILHKVLWKCYQSFSPKLEYHEMMGKKIYQEAWAKVLGFFGMYFYDYGYHNYPLKKRWFLKDIYLLGTFETEKYFKPIREILLREIVPIYPPKTENKELYDHILNENSVAISIRRGDFIREDETGRVHNVCGEKYFWNAINKIKTLVANPTFIFFSNDIEWVKQHYVIDDCNCYYESGHDEQWEVLRLMSSCKHFIISNSTFHWWAQYLCTNPNRITVAPKLWFRSDFPAETYQEEWELVDVD